jgi:hypothetical protein
VGFNLHRQLDNILLPRQLGEGPRWCWCVHTNSARCIVRSSGKATLIPIAVAARQQRRRESSGWAEVTIDVVGEQRGLARRPSRFSREQHEGVVAVVGAREGSRRGAISNGREVISTLSRVRGGNGSNSPRYLTDIVVAERIGVPGVWDRIAPRSIAGAGLVEVARRRHAVGPERALRLVAGVVEQHHVFKTGDARYPEERKSPITGTTVHPGIAFMIHSASTQDNVLIQLGTGVEEVLVEVQIRTNVLERRSQSEAVLLASQGGDAARSAGSDLCDDPAGPNRAGLIRYDRSGEARIVGCSNHTRRLRSRSYSDDSRRCFFS